MNTGPDSPSSSVRETEEHLSLYDAFKGGEKARAEEAWKNLGLDILIGLGFVQFIVGAWFTGAIIRREQSPYVWDEVRHAFNAFGLGNAVLAAILYSLYYFSFVELTYLLAKHWCSQRTRKKQVRFLPLLISAWSFATVLIFAPAIIAFMGALPVDILNGWLLIAWAGSAIWISRLLWMGR